MPAGFIVILGVFYEDRINILSKWALFRPFLLLVSEERFREWFRFLQQAHQLGMVCFSFSVIFNPPHGFVANWSMILFLQLFSQM